MFVILFSSRLSDEAGEEYYATEERLTERVRAIAGSDPVKIKQYTAEDGERLAVLFWQDKETLEKWRTDDDHRAAQRMGHTTWYSDYEVTVAEVVRTSAGGANTAARHPQSPEQPT
ncbi:antibiotic biosynthesis monooxygenase [Micromonospora sp. R77]|uniref:antibiotic biosynthesis monooxygenase family protein n=1 Tax=Micromonospora sp. R77 TaxID=2925836 RepID=UPI001F624666|nr:antibiotic biosynthesis monooxygenase [Micromonospora sp. R77]MCI4061477.1 antibiotic biosynthesis monooxygenase [Micromonospora sp. R77]